jgi:hypothetical protein
VRFNAEVLGVLSLAPVTDAGDGAPVTPEGRGTLRLAVHGVVLPPKGTETV